jgi:hypothetical protein
MISLLMTMNVLEAVQAFPSLLEIRADVRQVHLSYVSHLHLNVCSCRQRPAMVVGGSAPSPGGHGLPGFHGNLLSAPWGPMPSTLPSCFALSDPICGAGQ